MAQAIYRNYARVLFELQIGEDDLEMAKVLLQDKSIFRVLNHPFIKQKEKAAVIKRIFPKSTHNFLTILCQKKRLSSFMEILENYYKVKDEERGHIKAVLECTQEPDIAQIKALEDFVKTEYGAKTATIIIENKADLIGGFVLKVGNFEYDWSIKGRIKRLENQINGR